MSIYVYMCNKFTIYHLGLCKFCLHLHLFISAYLECFLEVYIFILNLLSLFLTSVHPIENLLYISSIDSSLFYKSFQSIMRQAQMGKPLQLWNDPYKPKKQGSIKSKPWCCHSFVFEKSGHFPMVVERKA